MKLLSATVEGPYFLIKGRRGIAIPVSGLPLTVVVRDWWVHYGPLRWELRGIESFCVPRWEGQKTSIFVAADVDDPVPEEGDRLYFTKRVVDDVSVKDRAGIPHTPDETAAFLDRESLHDAADVVRGLADLHQALSRAAEGAAVGFNGDTCGVCKEHFAECEAEKVTHSESPDAEQFFGCSGARIRALLVAKSGA